MTRRNWASMGGAEKSAPPFYFRQKMRIRRKIAKKQRGNAVRALGLNDLNRAGGLVKAFWLFFKESYRLYFSKRIL